MVASTRWGAPDKLDFRSAELQPVAAHPNPDVVDALRHPGLKQVDISRSSPSVHACHPQMRMEAVSGGRSAVYSPNNNGTRTADRALRHTEADALRRGLCCGMTDVLSTVGKV